MVITCSILFWGGLGFFIPKKYMRVYMVVAAIGMSSLYFLFQPTSRYDLYRHYEVLHILRKSNLVQILKGEFSRNNEILADMLNSSPLYLIYAYCISKLQIDELLVVITGIIIYTSTSNIILMASDDIDEDIADWKIAFCFFFLLAMLDYRTISGIRNMTAYALFANILYKDVVRNANKLLCFTAYIALANFHSSVWVLIAIRLMLELSRFIPKLVLMVGMLVSFSFVELILNFLKRFSSIQMIESLIIKMEAYGFGGGSKYIVSRAMIRVFHIIIYLSILMYCKKKIPKTQRFQKYWDFVVLFIMFTIGAISQYDIFVRGNVFMYFSILPFLLLFLHYVAGDTPLWVNIPGASGIGFSEVAVYFMIYAALALSFRLYFIEYYCSMDPGFIAGFRQLLS